MFFDGVGLFTLIIFFLQISKPGLFSAMKTCNPDFVIMKEILQLDKSSFSSLGLPHILNFVTIFTLSIHVFISSLLGLLKQSCISAF